MRAIGYQQATPELSADSFNVMELPDPVPKGRDLLVRVKALSVNPVDTKIRRNVSAEPGSFKILGWDAVGIVEQVGSEVSLFKPGDRVFYAGDISRQGTNAELHLVDERIVGPAPQSLSDAEAASLPLTAITAWELLFSRLGVSPGSDGKLLVIGAAGGVGSILVQLARQLTGLTVIGTASRPQTREWVEQLGAHHVIDHAKPLDEELAKLDIAEVDYVASLTHTDKHFTACVNALKPQGKLALIDDPGALDIGLMKRKSLSLHWEFMYTRPLFNTDDMQEQHNLLSRVADLVEQGAIKTTLGQHLGAISIPGLIKAHTILESGKACGKVVLEGFEF
ncbi:zinc-binding alcohol dehydrogenase family protein [Alteromonas aestuariivivens]|uniref:Zinc-type alcohol dehydrogenase-like protein n=1 Tax=Alteromonas aestuariivivens TaxID=1938339 RepID=A0A3D8MF82_9ALTE|nr:zinc-binding alcohol dehydrogenase family protein [Alteromonas aestuariivivens]RDV29286.1 zinc-binding alcohol dehydrogenase family protein [Alteromonas aestuariivivens]